MTRPAGETFPPCEAQGRDESDEWHVCAGGHVADADWHVSPAGHVWPNTGEPRFTGTWP